MIRDEIKLRNKKGTLRIESYKRIILKSREFIKIYLFLQNVIFIFIFKNKYNSISLILKSI